MNNIKNYKIVFNNTRTQNWEKIKKIINKYKTLSSAYTIQDNNIYFYLVNKKDNNIFLLLEDIQKKVDNLAILEEVKTKDNNLLYVGGNDKDSGKQEKTEAEAVEIIKRVVGGCIIQTGMGVYTYFDGHTEEEKTYIVKTINKMKAEKIEEIKKNLNQETCMKVGGGTVELV